MRTLETFMVYRRVVPRVIVVYRPIRTQITFMIGFFSTADTFITQCEFTIFVKIRKKKESIFYSHSDLNSKIHL